MQMDEGTQQNAALVEEAAAASEAIVEQAHALNEMIARYKVGTRLHAAAQARVDDDRTSASPQPSAGIATRSRRPSPALRSRTSSTRAHGREPSTATSRRAEIAMPGPLRIRAWAPYNPSSAVRLPDTMGIHSRQLEAHLASTDPAPTLTATGRPHRRIRVTLAGHRHRARHHARVRAARRVLRAERGAVRRHPRRWEHFSSMSGRWRCSCWRCAWAGSRGAAIGRRSCNCGRVSARSSGWPRARGESRAGAPAPAHPGVRAQASRARAAR